MAKGASRPFSLVGAVPGRRTSRSPPRCVVFDYVFFFFPAEGREGCSLVSYQLREGKGGASAPAAHHRARLCVAAVFHGLVFCSASVLEAKHCISNPAWIVEIEGKTSCLFSLDCSLHPAEQNRCVLAPSLDVLAPCPRKPTFSVTIVLSRHDCGVFRRSLAIRTRPFRRRGEARASEGAAGVITPGASPAPLSVVEAGVRSTLTYQASDRRLGLLVSPAVLKYSC